MRELYHKFFYTKIKNQSRWIRTGQTIENLGCSKISKIVVAGGTSMNIN